MPPAPSSNRSASVRARSAGRSTCSGPVAATVRSTSTSCPCSTIAPPRRRARTTGVSVHRLRRSGQVTGSSIAAQREAVSHRVTGENIGEELPGAYVGLQAEIASETGTAGVEGVRSLGTPSGGELRTNEQLPAVLGQRVELGGEAGERNRPFRLAQRQRDLGPCRGGGVQRALVGAPGVNRPRGIGLRGQQGAVRDAHRALPERQRLGRRGVPGPADPFLEVV